MFYTYVLFNPLSGKPFYVGKGKEKRLHRHEEYALRGRTAGNLHLYNTIRKIKNSGETVLFEKVVESTDEDYCYWLEIYLIDHLGRRDVGAGPLLNMTNGGEGYSGGIVSIETRKKLGAAGIGRPSPQKGKALTVETKLKLSAAKKGRKGCPRSIETRIKISKANRGRILTLEQRTRLTNGHLGMKRSNITRERIRVCSLERSRIAKETGVPYHKVRLSKDKLSELRNAVV